MKNSKNYLWTGMTGCYDDRGKPVPCSGSGQDAEHQPGVRWPKERFVLVADELVEDRATGLVWASNAGLLDFPVSWTEGLAHIRQMNQERWFDRDDWRMPNRRELRSLIDHKQKQPALPEHHPFRNVFLGWHWSSTTSAIAPRYAWHVHLEGGRMFYGNKDGFGWLWPVCGTSEVLPVTGANMCYHEDGRIAPCLNTLQDAEVNMGVPWPEPRFVLQNDAVCDLLTGLVWAKHADITGGSVSWNGGLAAIARMRRESGQPWRLPTINELESLVDASRHSPALPRDHPFISTQEAYWSSTTSGFETDWAFALYLHKGAVGVGYKQNSDFSIWPVR